ncbi:MAG: MotA/TolQ/ExbB proton channel family protein [Aquificae bacterium]|nr:MotA/TolQ/ExbB proton channel family protein [Aquificota bacterium]
MEALAVVWKNAPVVFVLLLLIATVSTAIFLEKLVSVKKSKVLPRGWRQIKLYLAAGNYEAAIAALKRDGRPLARALANLLELYHRGEISKLELVQLVEAEGNLLYYELTKKTSFLSASVTLATLVGLIGTVWGLIKVFAAYSSMGAEGIRLLAEGIATSLNSTAAGLLVAVYGYLLYWLVRERINGVYSKVLRELEEFVELIK